MGALSGLDSGAVAATGAGAGSPMGADAGATPAPPPWRGGAWVAAGLLTVALLVRGATFGNPVLHVDEQFYLLVGDRMWHGAIPYVDIWDRKPIGLFLLYAAIRLLGGEGFLQYQLVATLFAAATSFTIYHIARAIAPPVGAWWAGVGYLLYLSVFNCIGGQSPVFYNLPVALAALTLLRAWTAPDASHLLRRGAGAMALIGLAIQIKYTVVFEGVGFGLALLARGFVAGWRLPRLGLAALLWAGIALAPTLAAWAAYAAMGHGQAFVFANFVSIFGRRYPLLPALGRLAKDLGGLIGFWLAIFYAPRHLPSLGAINPWALKFLRWWAVVAVGGFLLFGTWHDHYTPPIIMPLAVLAAPVLGWQGLQRRYTALLIGGGLLAAIIVTISNRHKEGSAAQVDHAASLIRSHLAGGCLYVFEGNPVALFQKTGACLPTAYIFPTHLSTAVERQGLGVDQVAEEKRVIARAPAVIVTTPLPYDANDNYTNRALLMAGLSRNYTCFASVPIGKYPFNLYQRRDLAPKANALTTKCPAMQLYKPGKHRP